MKFLIYLTVVPWLNVAASVSINNDNCTYEFEMDQNVIRVSCAKNVTVTVRGKGNTLLMSGQTDRRQRLWFEPTSTAGVKNNKTFRDGCCSTKALGKLKDSVSLLKRTKKKLLHRIKTLDNITESLELGDQNLDSDLENLKGYSPGSVYAHQATIAALTNQYRYLQMAMLTQNNEMREIISAMTTLVSATQKSVRSAMAMNEWYQEELVLMNTALVQANISRVDKRKDFCPRQLTSIEKIGKEFSVGIAEGSIMKDPIPGGLYWITYGYSDINKIVGFSVMSDFNWIIPAMEKKLPFFCEGTGHVVYKNCLYCHKMMTTKVVKYNLLQSRWVGEMEIVGAGAHNAFPYQSDRFTDIDFAVDELGLWVVYATGMSAGNIVISKIDVNSFNITETWLTSIPKRTVGNTFMICGILYATNSYKDTPTFIKYSYNTNTGGGKTYTANDIPFQNAVNSEYARNYMLDYNPLDRKLYSWNHVRIEIYSVLTSKVP